eukprot:6490619-Amphidinium_carterae.1
MAKGMDVQFVNIRPAEDISIEFVPNHIEANANKTTGQETAMLNLKGAMGQPIGVWNIDEWQRIDNKAQATIWLDHSISAWSQSDTRWRLNEFSAITMLNTHSMSRTFPQLVRTEKFDDSSQQVLGGRWHNHAAVRHGRQWRGAQPQSGNGATPLAQRQSHGLDESADGNSCNNAGNGTELQWTSPVTIMHSSATMTLANDGR